MEISRGAKGPLKNPIFFQGKVIKGFGRGSKKLGCPTANIPIEEYEELLEKIENGVYWGWASVEGSDTVYGMALNVGWSPYFKNEKKTIEIHVFHEFEEDFYGSQIRALALGYIRPELDFNSLEELIAAISGDISWSKEQLLSELAVKFEKDKFFTSKAREIEL